MTPQAASRRRLTVTAALLAGWFAVTFGLAYFARDLQFNFLGWPFSFWVGAQGALIAYWLITWVYARTMSRLDAEEGAARTLSDPERAQE